MVKKYDPEKLLDSNPTGKYKENVQRVLSGDMSPYLFKCYLRRAVYNKRRYFRMKEIDAGGNGLKPEEMLSNKMIGSFHVLSGETIPEQYRPRLKELQKALAGKPISTKVIADTIRAYVFQNDDNPVSVAQVIKKAEVQTINRKAKKNKVLKKEPPKKQATRFEYDPADPRPREIQLQAFAKTVLKVSITPYATGRRRIINGN